MKSIALRHLGTGLVLGGVLAQGALAQPVPPRPVTELGARFPIALSLAAQPASARRAAVVHPTPAGATASRIRYMRVRMELRGGERGSWYLTIRDDALRPLEVLTAESFQSSKARWSTRINSSRLMFDLDLADASAETMSVKVALTEYIAMPEKAQTPYYSSQDPVQPGYVDLFKSGGDPLRRLGDSVGFVMGSYDQASWCCTGVVVGPDLLLTNWHCGGKPGETPEAAYWSSAACADTIVDLSWDGDAVSREFRCTEVLCRDRDLDFALIRMAPLAAEDVAKPLLVRTAPPLRDEPLTLIHHPECLPKQVTTGCSVLDPAYRGWTNPAAAVDLSHKCDTEEGSSGGAVLDGAGRLLGLHHTGFDQSTDAAARAGRFNTAVRADKIVDFLKAAPGSATCAAGLDRLIAQ